MAREGAFRERVDVDSAPPLPRPFRLPTASRKSFSISPHKAPGKPKFKPFRFSSYQPLQWSTPPHKDKGKKNQRHYDPNTYVNVRKQNIKNGKVYVNGRQMFNKAGKPIKKAGLYRPVTMTVKGGLTGGYTTVTRYVEVPILTKSMFLGLNHMQVEKKELAWLWKYDRAKYWDRWKKYYQPKRAELNRDAREEYERQKEKARYRYDKAKKKALDKWREAKAKYDKWDARMRAQFD